MWSRCCSRRGRQIHRLPAQKKNCWPSSCWPVCEDIYWTLVDNIPPFVFFYRFNKWESRKKSFYVKLITTLHRGGTAKWLQYYIGGVCPNDYNITWGGVSRDPQKWLRNMCTTPYNVFNYVWTLMSHIKKKCKKLYLVCNPPPRDLWPRDGSPGTHSFCSRHR